MLDPKWKGKIVVFDPKAGGFAATRDRFFFHNPELGPPFLRRLFSEMAPTLYARYPQGEDWLATGKYSLCLCRHQSISEAKSQGLPVDLMEPEQFKEGVGVETRAKTMVLMNQAPHPNAAKVFLNWFLSREGQITLQRALAKSTDEAPDSLRIDIPKDDVPAENKRVEGVKYMDLDVQGKLEMKPIVAVIEEALGASKK